MCQWDTELIENQEKIGSLATDVFRLQVGLKKYIYAQVHAYSLERKQGVGFEFRYDRFLSARVKVFLRGVFKLFSF